MSDPVNPAIRSVIELFASDLAAVKFPDMDAAVLTSSAESVVQRTDELSRAEAALDKARLDLTDAQEALLLKSHRALNYAKVFAEDDTALAAKLEAIALPRAPRRPAARDAEPLLTATEAPAEKPSDAPRPPAKRRGRPPKVLISTNAPLFGPMPEETAAEMGTAES
jgi:hypothetical protein